MYWIKVSRVIVHVHTILRGDVLGITIRELVHRHVLLPRFLIVKVSILRVHRPILWSIKACFFAAHLGETNLKTPGHIRSDSVFKMELNMFRKLESCTYTSLFKAKLNIVPGALNDTSAETKSPLRSAAPQKARPHAVLLFSKLNQTFFGYFHPENIYIHDTNKYFLGWPNRYFG